MFGRNRLGSAEATFICSDYCSMKHTAGSIGIRRMPSLVHQATRHQPPAEVENPEDELKMMKVHFDECVRAASGSTAAHGVWFHGRSYRASPTLPDRRAATALDHWANVRTRVAGSAKLCHLVGNVLRSPEQLATAWGDCNGSLPRDDPSRRSRHRLPAANLRLGSKPVACTGSLLR